MKSFKIIVGLLIVSFLIVTISADVIIDTPKGGDIINVFTGINLTNLSQLADTNVPAPGDNEVLTWNAASQLWVSQAVNLSIFGTGKAGDGVYLFNNTNTMFFNDTLLNITILDLAGGGNVTNLTDLGDVNVPTPSNNSVLTFNGTSSLWEAVVSAAAGLWQSIGGITSLITPEDVNMQQQSIVNISNITLLGSVQDESQNISMFFDNGIMVVGFRR